MREYAIECAWQQRGVLDVYTDAARLADACRGAEAAAAFGVDHRVVDGAGARALEPTLTDAIVGGVFHPSDSNLHPARFLAGFAAAVAGRGVDVRPGVEIADWTHEDSTGFTLTTTDRGSIRAGQVVVAAGVGSPHFQSLLGVRIPVVGARGFSVTGPLSGREPSLPLLLGERHIAVAPMGDEWRVSGGFQLVSGPHPSTEAEITRLLGTVRERVAGDYRPTFPSRWSGLRPVAADGVPIIGPAPGRRDVVIATGHHMGGLSFGAATGRAAARLVTGADPGLDLTPFDPARFGPH